MYVEFKSAYEIKNDYKKWKKKSPSKHAQAFHCAIYNVLSHQLFC